jgi:chromosomal replication initiator protein
MIHDLSLSGYSLGIQTAPQFMFQVRPRLTVKRIQEAVARYYDISPMHMVGESKEARHAQPRQLAMYLAREMLGRSTPDIGRLFGGRDHTTVLHALSAVSKRMKMYPDIVEEIEAIKAELRG